jgi:hypothetical protein
LSFRAAGVTPAARHWQGSILGLLAAPARASIISSDVAPGIPDRFARVREIGPWEFLVDSVFGAAHSIQRFQHVLDVAEIDLCEAVDVLGCTFGLGKVSSN